MLKLKDLKILESMDDLSRIPSGKVLINTINAHSYNTAQKDPLFADALKNGDYLIPDGASIVMACRWLKAKSRPKERIAGWDLFVHEMEKLSEECRVKSEECDLSEKRRIKSEEGDLSEERRVKSEECATNTLHDYYAGKENSAKGKNPSLLTLNSSLKKDSSLLTLPSSLKKKVMFLGSSEEVLARIRQETSYVYHGIEVVTYSPPYKPVFSDEDNRAMIDAVNAANPDLLWIGMTAPKQEKWVYEHWYELDIHCHVGTIGAVFDFFAGTAKRAPLWWQRHSLEWLYRLIIEPKRMWRRYLVGNVLFVWNVIKECLTPDDGLTHAPSPKERGVESL